MNNMIKVGVGSILLKERSVLLGLRNGAHGKHHWGFPGGHLEYNETPEACAKRETYEETGLIINKLYPGPWTNDFFEEKKHYITLFVIAEYEGGEVELREPNKCTEWRWATFDNLPEPLFLPIRNMFSKGFTLDYLYRLLKAKLYENINTEHMVI